MNFPPQQVLLLGKSENIRNNMTELCEQYIQTLSTKERKSYEIAKSHLGTSFTLEKSNGFLSWCKENEKGKEK